MREHPVKQFLGTPRHKIVVMQSFAVNVLSTFARHVSCRTIRQIFQEREDESWARARESERERDRESGSSKVTNRCNS